MSLLFSYYCCGYCILGSLEFEAEVDVEVNLLGEVAPADGTAQRSNDAVVGVGELGAPDGLILEDSIHFVVMHGGVTLNHQVVLLEQPLLQLESCNQ